MTTNLQRNGEQQIQLSQMQPKSKQQPDESMTLNNSRATEPGFCPGLCRLFHATNYKVNFPIPYILTNGKKEIPSYSFHDNPSDEIQQTRDTSHLTFLMQPYPTSAC